MRPTSEDMTSIVKDEMVVNPADGSSIESTARVLFNPGFKDASKHSAIVIPSITEPLLSASSLADTGIVSVFDKDKCTFGLYYSSNVRVNPHLSEKCNLANTDLMLWHRRFNHTNIQMLRRKLRIAGVTVAGGSEQEVRDCRVCLQGKRHQRHMQSRDGHRATKAFRVIHSDVSEYGTSGRDGSKCFVFFLLMTTQNYSEVTQSKTNQTCWTAFENTRMRLNVLMG